MTGEELVRMRSAVRICPAAPKRTENFSFRCVFVAKTPKMVWVKMWVNCLTHTVTHTGKHMDGNNGTNRLRPLPFWTKKRRKALYSKGWKALRQLVRMRSQPVCSIVSIRSFPRVGHGVGQAETSASKKPRTGFAVIFRFAVSLS